LEEKDDEMLARQKREEAMCKEEKEVSSLVNGAIEAFWLHFDPGFGVAIPHTIQ